MPLALAAFTLIWLLRTLPLVEWLEWLQLHAEKLGPSALLLTALLFGIGSIFFLPTTLVAAAAGATFGIWLGFLSLWLGWLLAVVIVWMIGGRFSGPMRRKFEQMNPNAEAILEALNRRGWSLVFLTQLHPLAPAGLLNYLYPSLKLNWRTAIPAILVARSPTLLMYSALGYWSAKGLTTESEELAWLWWVSIAAAILVCAVLAKIISKAIQEATKRGGDHPPAS